VELQIQLAALITVLTMERLL